MKDLHPKGLVIRHDLQLCAIIGKALTGAPVYWTDSPKNVTAPGNIQNPHWSCPTGRNRDWIAHRLCSRPSRNSPRRHSMFPMGKSHDQKG
jgi:hypothetical protein